MVLIFSACFAIRRIVIYKIKRNFGLDWGNSFLTKLCGEFFTWCVRFGSWEIGLKACFSADMFRDNYSMRETFKRLMTVLGYMGIAINDFTHVNHLLLTKPLFPFKRWSRQIEKVLIQQIPYPCHSFSVFTEQWFNKVYFYDLNARHGVNNVCRYMESDKILKMDLV